MDTLDFNSQFTGAVFSPCHKYRLVLWRNWRPEKPRVMFIGLNPSTADAQTDDATIRRVIAFAQSWGYGGIYMLNLFTYISTNPHNLLSAENPIYMANEYLYEYRDRVDKVVFMWGNNKTIGKRAEEVINMFSGAYCFGKNKDGSPKHPLYLSSETNLQLYKE